MQKKVKSGQYKNKKQFAHDLGLIWDNCLIYNSDPNHPLRRNVAFMRKKADHLLEFLGEKSDVGNWLRSWGGSELKVADVTVEGEGKVEVEEKKKEEEEGRRKRKVGEVPFEEQEAFVRTPQGMLAFGKLDASLSQLEQQAGPSSRPYMVVEAMERIKVEAEDEDPLSAVLPDIFPSLIRKGKEKASPEPNRSQSEPVSATTPAPTTDISTLDASADWLTVTSSHSLMTGALPALPSSSRIPPTPQEEPGRGKKRKKPYHLVPATRRKGLPGRIARNIRTLHKVQETHNKFLSLAHYVENEAPIPAYLTALSSDEEESDYPSEPEDPSHPQHLFEPPQNPLRKLSPDSAREHIDHTVRMVLAHQGFEGGHRVAVDVLSDVLGEFLGSMGRLLKVYADRRAHDMSVEEMILHTLQETSNSTVHTLENYIRNDVERYSSKLTDLLRKLRSSYREQFNLSTERGVIEDEALFADNGEALVAGNFAEGLGDDFFGFRELGLDRELGMAGLTVPTRLFYGRNRNSAANLAARGGVGGKEEVLPYPPPPEPVLLTAAAVGGQIGLLHGFYQEKLREHRQRLKHQEAAKDEGEDGEGEKEKEKPDPVVLANTLPDQEQEKQRYKVPPTGKMPRRVIWSVAAERKLVQERQERERLEKAEREKEKQQQANGGVGGVVMSTGGAGAGAGGGGGKKVKKSAIAA